MQLDGADFPLGGVVEGHMSEPKKISLQQKGSNLPPPKMANMQKKYVLKNYSKKCCHFFPEVICRVGNN